MNGLPYYKRYPRDFIEGTIGLGFELKTAYAFLLDLIYMQGGQLPDEPRYISGLMECSIRKWKSLRQGLIDAGKIAVSGGFLINFRAVSELETLAKLSRKQAENASAPRKNNNLEKPRLSHTEPYSEIEKRTPDGVPKKTTPRSELLAVLDDEHAEAVIEHRQRIRKPLTPRAGRLLANKFARCPDPNAAADAMVANGWQGFEPEWLERIRSTGPPNQGPTYSDIRREAERKLAELESRPNDHRPDPVLRLVAQ